MTLNLRPAALLALTLVLGGCDLTTGSLSGAGLSAFAPVTVPSLADTSPASSAIAAMLGPRFGKGLDATDRQLAFDAQVNALDNGAPGAPVPWNNPQSGHRGNIVAGPVYIQHGNQCRGFSHTVIINDQLYTSRGTACRTPDGNWMAA